MHGGKPDSLNAAAAFLRLGLVPSISFVGMAVESKRLWLAAIGLPLVAARGGRRRLAGLPNGIVQGGLYFA